MDSAGYTRDFWITAGSGAVKKDGRWKPRILVKRMAACPVEPKSLATSEE
jgi:hypothetical protein